MRFPSSALNRSRPGFAPGRVLALAALLSLPPSLAVAQSDYDAGVAAYQAQDFAGARAILTPLAEAGDARARYVLGTLLQQGLGGAADPAGAAALYAQAAEAGIAAAQFNLGAMLLGGSGVAEDRARGIALLRQAAESGYGPARQRLAEADLQIADPVLQAQATLARAEKGDRDAMAEMARRYRDGDGVPRESGEAQRWLLAAADARDPDAAMEAWRLFSEGVGGTAINITRALPYLTIAAEEGNPEAQRLYAIELEEGILVRRDSVKALEYLERAMEGGDSEAMLRLGKLLMEGSEASGGSEGVKQDQRRGEALLLAAFEAGQAQASLLLARYYLAGSQTGQEILSRGVGWLGVAQEVLPPGEDLTEARNFYQTNRLRLRDEALRQNAEQLTADKLALWRARQAAATPTPTPTPTSPPEPGSPEAGAPSLAAPPDAAAPPMPLPTASP